MNFKLLQYNKKEENIFLKITIYIKENKFKKLQFILSIFLFVYIILEIYLILFPMKIIVNNNYMTFF